MTSASDNSIFRMRFHLLFSYVSTADSGHTLRSRSKHQSSNLSGTNPAVIGNHGGQSYLLGTSEASLSAATRAMQHRVRMRYHQRLERIADRESLHCLHAGTKLDPKIIAQTDRPSLEVLEVATNLRSMEQKIEQLHSHAQKNLSQLPEPAQALSPPRPRAGKLHSGTSPHNTASSPTSTGGTKFDVDSLPSELPSDPTDSDLFRIHHEKLFSPKESADEQPCPAPAHEKLPADSIVQDWLAAGTGSGGHQSLFKEVSKLAAEEVEASLASEALMDIARLTDMDLVCREKEAVDGAGHSVDSWNDDDPGAAPASVGEETVEADDDECEWLDLGPMNSAE